MEEQKELEKELMSMLTSKVANYALPLESRGTNDESDEARNEIGIENFLNLLSDLYVNEESDVSNIICEENKDVAALKRCAWKMNSLKDRYDDCKKTMNDLVTDYISVTERTSSLHNACDRMMAHQTQIASGAEQIRANLYYYTQHESIMKKLSSGNLSVTGQVFMQLLATIDECLTFLRKHLHYKDSLTYISKYEHCLSKAMTAIRSTILTELDASYQAVRDRQSQLEADYPEQSAYADDDTFALLYGVFAARATTVQSAKSVAEQRFASVPEFQSVLSDCYQAYFAIRYQLVEPVLQKTIEKLLSRHADSSCGIARNGCSFLLRLCDDEFRLYKQFFGMNDGSSSQRSPATASNPTTKAALESFLGSTDSFDDFIESLCRIFYDVLRPIIIHNPHLETLAELCTIIKVEMIEERCNLMVSLAASRFDGDSSGDDICSASTIVNPRNGFVRVMSELAGDVAERIVHRAGLYIRTDIIGFQPSAGDLAYPDKLEMMKNIEKEHILSKQNDSSSGETPSTASAIDLHCLWYPVVRRTVLCLSKLYKCLDPAVFQSIARELLKACCQSLKYAAEQIKTTRTDKVSKSRRVIDGDLFIVKHLLILREQTSPYRNNSLGYSNEVIPEREYALDLSKYKKTASHLFAERQRWFEFTSNNAFLEVLFQVPIVVSESVGDSRRIIDVHLKDHCHLLIQHVLDMIVLELADFIAKAESLVNEPDFDINSHDVLKVNAIQDLVGQTYKKLKTFWPEIRVMFDLYIGVKDTEEVLLQPVKKSITDVFTRTTIFVQKHYDEEQQKIACVPSQENIWLIVNS